MVQEEPAERVATPASIPEAVEDGYPTALLAQSVVTAGCPLLADMRTILNLVVLVGVVAPTMAAAIVLLEAAVATPVAVVAAGGPVAIIEVPVVVVAVLTTPVLIKATLQEPTPDMVMS